MPPDTTSNMPDIIIDFIVFIFLVFQIIKTVTLTPKSKVRGKAYPEPAVETSGLATLAEVIYPKFWPSYRYI